MVFVFLFFMLLLLMMIDSVVEMGKWFKNLFWIKGLGWLFVIGLIFLNLFGLLDLILGFFGDNFLVGE